MSEPDLSGLPPEPVPEPERYPFWGYQDLMLFAGLALPSLVGGAILVKVVTLSAGWTLPGKAAELLAMQFTGYTLWFAALFGLLRMRYNRPFWASLAWVRPLEAFGRNVISGVVLAFAVTALALLMKTPDLDMPMKELLGDRTSIILVAFFGSTLGPLCEELAFRGFLLPLLARSLGLVPGVVLAALPFALLHGPQYGWSWQHVVLITLAGAVFGWKRLSTGSTAAATIMHAAYNLTFFIGLLFQGKDAPIKW